MHQSPCSPGFCSVMEGRVLAGRRRSWRTSEPRGPERPHHSDVRHPEPKPLFRGTRARLAQPVFDFEWHCTSLQLFQLFGDKFPSLETIHAAAQSPSPSGRRLSCCWLAALPGWTGVCTLQALKLAVWVAWLCRCCRQFGGFWLTLFALALELVRIWRHTPLFSCPDSKQKAHTKLGYLQILLLTELFHKTSPNRSPCHQPSGSCMCLTEPMLLLCVDIATPPDSLT